MSDDALTVWEAQHQEIDSAQKDLDRMQQQVKSVLDLRYAETPNVVETYLRGLYDGVNYAEERVERITQYDERPRVEVAQRVSDDTLARQLSAVLSEAGNGNWGNARVNLENALEKVKALDDETEEVTADAAE